MVKNSDLILLAEKWEARTRNKFKDADQAKDEFGKRFIEHGAMCYFNCAQELRRLADLPDLALQPLLNDVESKTCRAAHTV